MPPSPVQNRLPDRLAKAAKPQVAPANLEGMSLEITEELIALQTPEAQAIIRALLAKIQGLQDRLCRRQGIYYARRRVSSNLRDAKGSDAMTNLVFLSLGLMLGAAVDQPKAELLWPKAAPDAEGTEERDKPSLTIYRPPAEKANGAAVVVCPGGGYGGLAVGHEGKEPAEWLNRHGIAAFVLRYRLGPRYRHPAPLQDAQRALRIVRSRAKEWSLDPKRIGIWGFSAGGHLASTLATHFDDGKPDADDPIERVSCRPDFAILCYPVITMRPPFTHDGSRRNLLGDKAEKTLVASLCNEEQVTEKTPPTFLFHTNEDTAVPPENSILFYQALRKKKVPAELHIYEKGPHGAGLGAGRGAVSAWPEQLAGWLKARGLLTPGKD